MWTIAQNIDFCRVWTMAMVMMIYPHNNMILMLKIMEDNGKPLLLGKAP